jgi:hypothetical protein
MANFEERAKEETKNEERHDKTNCQYNHALH